ncbi:hypothetical protein [Ensifer sp. B1-9]|uniref:hypothetical protein n=1 Tax=Ensifer sp. B1-9 TaxID=3141455 RepID=UPI003D1B1EC0
MDSHAVIEALPLNGDQRAALIEIANRVFEKVIDRIEPENENLTRKLWDPGDYIDNHFFQMLQASGRDGILPMKLDYADYLIDAFLWHHVVDIAEQADKQAELN